MPNAFRTKCSQSPRPNLLPPPSGPTPAQLYRVDDLEPHEAWLAQVFQPCHEEHFTNLPRGPLKWYLHDREPLPVDANIAMLTAKNPNVPGSWKEALVFRELRMVQVYRIRSHGRRYFRSLEYTSNALLSLHALQPSTDGRRQPWPRWSRHEAMEDDFKDMLQEYEPPLHDPSLVIIRERKRIMPKGDAPPSAEPDGVAEEEEAAADEQAEADGTAAGHRNDLKQQRFEPQDIDQIAEIAAAAPELHGASEPQEPLPDDEWTPAFGSLAKVSGQEEEEAEDVDGDEESVRPKAEPPPPEVFEMLERRRARVQAAFDLVTAIVPTLSEQKEASAPMVPLYQITDILYYDKGIHPLRNTTPTTCGLGGAYTGKVQFEIVFKSSYLSEDVTIGWTRPAAPAEKQEEQEEKEEEDGEEEREEGEEEDDDSEDDDDDSDEEEGGGAASSDGVSWKKSWVGFTADSWGLSPSGGKKWHDAKDEEFVWAEGDTEVAKWRSGEVVSVAADLDAGELWFARNGRWLKAFAVDAPDGLCPAISLDSFNYFGINWGEAPFSFPREGFTPLASAEPVKPASAPAAAPAPALESEEAVDEAIAQAVDALWSKVASSVVMCALTEQQEEPGAPAEPPRKKAARLSEEADKFVQAGKTDEAIELYLLACSLEKEASGADSPKAAAHLRRLGTAYQRQGKMEAAGLALKEAESILESAHGSKHPEVQPAPASASTSSLPASAHACADPLPMLALISSRSTAGEGVEAAAARRTRPAPQAQDAPRLRAHPAHDRRGHRLRRHREARPRWSGHDEPGAARREGRDADDGRPGGRRADR